MKNLWAPWRMKYLEEESNNQSGECIFCPRIAADEDEKNLIVYRGPLTVVFMNRYPYNGGHLLVMPKRHLAELEDLDDPELMEIFHTLRLARQALEKTMAPHGYNIGINLGQVAGAGVPGHLHLHIVPRWTGDTNFMPVFGDVKVIPEDLFTTRQKLARAFEQLKPSGSK
jgi:ATP adenylyltransferase